MIFNKIITNKIICFSLQFFEKHIIRANSMMNNRSYNYIQSIKSIQIPERKGQLIQTTTNLDIETRWLLSMLNSNSDDNIKLQLGLNAGVCHFINNHLLVLNLTRVFFIDSCL